MAGILIFDETNLCTDYRFVRVLSQNGVFYDLVRKWNVRAHIYLLKQIYPDAQTLTRASVPPCLCRDFTDLNENGGYHMISWKNGTQRLFSPNQTEQAILAERGVKP